MDDIRSGKITKYAVVIGALAVIVLIMLAIVMGFAKQARTDTTATVTGITLATNNTATLLASNPFVQSATNCKNDSATANYTLSTSFYSVDEGTSSGGSITLNNDGGNWSGATVNCSVRYLADSAGSATGDKFVTGITIFATFTGVLVLAIIGMIIVSLYKKDNE